MERENWMLFIIMGLMFLEGIILSQIYNGMIKTDSNELEYKDSNCSNLDLLNTSYCLREELKTFYKYNLSNIKTNLTLEQLKEFGGVCWHYSQWYFDNIGNNFYKEQVRITTYENENVNEGHKFTIISNKEGYCTLDMLDVQCHRFK